MVFLSSEYCAGSTRLSLGTCTGASATAAGRGSVSATLASTVRQ